MEQRPEPDTDRLAVFRETFLRELQDPEPIAAFQGFARHLYHLALEAYRPWHGTPAAARADQLTAVAADLRYLAKHLREIGLPDDYDPADDPMTPRDRRWTRYASELAPRLERIVEEITVELREGLEEKDEDD